MSGDSRPLAVSVLVVAPAPSTPSFSATDVLVLDKLNDRPVETHNDIASTDDDNIETHHYAEPETNALYNSRSGYMIAKIDCAGDYDYFTACCTSPFPVNSEESNRIEELLASVDWSQLLYEEAEKLLVDSFTSTGKEEPSQIISDKNIRSNSIISPSSEEASVVPLSLKGFDFLRTKRKLLKHMKSKL
jgi:hypothetical protein